MATRRTPLSLKGRGLALLAQRDHSRAELRRKLMPQARAELALATLQVADVDNAAGAEAAGLLSAAERVTEVLDWLQAHRYLSEERFVDTRVHARAPKFGNLRIRHELSQHGVALTPEASQRLAETEFERAQAVQQRKFGRPPANAAEHAKQTRFLAGRGFASDVIRQVMRQIGRAADPQPPTGVDGD
jgi:regulatory protein